MPRQSAGNLGAEYRVVAAKFNEFFIHNAHQIDHTREPTIIDHSISPPPLFH